MVAVFPLLSKTGSPTVPSTAEACHLGTSASATAASQGAAPWGPQPPGPSPVQTPAVAVQPLRCSMGPPSTHRRARAAHGEQEGRGPTSPTGPAHAAAVEAQITAGSVWSRFPEPSERLCPVRARWCLLYSGLWLLAR